MLLGPWKELTMAEKAYEIISIGWICSWLFFVYAHIRLAYGP